MKFLKEYKQIKNNYCSLNSIERFIVWMRFKITPLEKLLDLIPDQGKLLDLGCGFGLFSYFFAQKYPNLRVIGVDPSEGRIKLANNVFLKPENLKFYQSKIEDLKEDDFDAIILIDVIYLLPSGDLIKTLKICREKLNKGGVLIIKTMNKAHFFRYLFSVVTPTLINKLLSISHFKIFGSREEDPRYYRPGEFKDILKKAGWEDVEIWDLPLRFFIYPHIIYSCRKELVT